MPSEIRSNGHERCKSIEVLASPDAGQNAPFCTGYPVFSGVAASHPGKILSQLTSGIFTPCKENRQITQPLIQEPGTRAFGPLHVSPLRCERRRVNPDPAFGTENAL